jgi:hypothetical protein
MDPRVVKPHTPVKLIVTSVVIGLLVLAFVIMAVWQSMVGITDARKRGVVISKEFVPEPERQITLGRQGNMTARDREGRFWLKVEVPQGDGTKKYYDVEIMKKDQFDSIKEGDSFDVGPFLVK